MSRYRISLIPKLFSHWWETLEQPHGLMNQRFSMRLHPEYYFFGPSFFQRRFPLEKIISEDFFRPWSEFIHQYENGWSIVKNDNNKFYVSLDVQQFKPDEIIVKMVDDFIIVEGKHDEKEDEHGLVSRHFVRKYMVPEQCNPEKITSTLSSDGVLTIIAPRKPKAAEAKKERVINVEYSEKSAVEDNSEIKQTV